MKIIRVIFQRKSQIIEGPYQIPLTWSTIGSVGIIVMAGASSTTGNILPLKLSEIALSSGVLKKLFKAN